MLQLLGTYDKTVRKVHQARHMTLVVNVKIYKPLFVDT